MAHQNPWFESPSFKHTQSPKSLGWKLSTGIFLPVKGLDIFGNSTLNKYLDLEQEKRMLSFV